jgi:hypothetical protein
MNVFFKLHCHSQSTIVRVQITRVLRFKVIDENKIVKKAPQENLSLCTSVSLEIVAITIGNSRVIERFTNDLLNQVSVFK